MTRTSHSSTRRTPYLRKATVLVAVVSAVAIYVVAVHGLGVELRSPEMGDAPSANITVMHVGVSSLVAALAAWAALAVLERLTARAHGIWVGVAIVALLVSLGAPLTGDGVDAADRAVLVLLHLSVAGVIIPGMLYPARLDRRSNAASTAGNEEVAS